MTRCPLLTSVAAFALIATPGVAGHADGRGWVPLFDGWKVNGGTASSRVEDGAIVGTTVEGSPNTFLSKGDHFKGFVLELEVRCDPALDSGVRVRSHVLDGDDPDPSGRRRAGVVYGPQCQVARKEAGTSAPTQAAGPRVHRDLPYAGAKEGRQTLDVYAPAEGEGHPVAVWIHGGGWQVGDKTEVDAKPQGFVDRGFVFVSVNYRLLPEATIKQMAGDVALAIRWTHDHAREYGGDPGTIVVMGHSAGAQLAALVCTDDRYLKAEGLSLSGIKACVPVDGDTYDVPVQVGTVEERRATSYRKKFGDEASQKELSPITHVARDKGIPPFLILHVADHPETGGQSRRLVKALREAGVPAEAFPAEGKTHGTINSDLGKPGDVPSKAMFEFLDGALKR